MPMPKKQKRDLLVEIKVMVFFGCRGIRGDLYLVLRIKGKDGVWREGLNLFSRIRISYTEAILGTMIKVC